jgi:hypothetical protein
VALPADGAQVFDRLTRKWAGDMPVIQHRKQLPL